MLDIELTCAPCDLELLMTVPCAQMFVQMEEAADLQYIVEAIIKQRIEPPEEVTVVDTPGRFRGTRGPVFWLEEAAFLERLEDQKYCFGYDTRNS